jgi:hypothetical protein
MIYKYELLLYNTKTPDFCHLGSKSATNMPEMAKIVMNCINK